MFVKKNIFIVEIKRKYIDDVCVVYGIYTSRKKADEAARKAVLENDGDVIANIYERKLNE